MLSLSFGASEKLFKREIPKHLKSAVVIQQRTPGHKPSFPNQTFGYQPLNNGTVINTAHLLDKCTRNRLVIRTIASTSIAAAKAVFRRMSSAFLIYSAYPILYTFVRIVNSQPTTGAGVHHASNHRQAVLPYLLLYLNL